MSEHRKLSPFQRELFNECKKYQLKTQFLGDKFCISTAFEEFWFKCSLDYVAIEHKQVKRLDIRKDFQPIAKTQMKPSEIVKLVLSLRTVTNIKTYKELYFKELEKCCNKYKLRCEEKSNSMHIYTVYEEFYVRVDQENVELMHYSTKNNTKKERYHQQFKNDMKPENIVKYIKKHTKRKANPIPSRLDKCFKLIEKQRKQKEFAEQLIKEEQEDA